MSEARDGAAGQDSGYTVVGIVNDGAELNRVVSDLRTLRIDDEDLTVVLNERFPTSRSLARRVHATSACPTTTGASRFP